MIVSILSILLQRSTGQRLIVWDCKQYRVLSVDHRCTLWHRKPKRTSCILSFQVWRGFKPVSTAQLNICNFLSYFLNDLFIPNYPFFNKAWFLTDRTRSLKSVSKETKSVLCFQNLYMYNKNIKCSARLVCQKKMNTCAAWRSPSPLGSLPHHQPLVPRPLSLRFWVGLRLLNRREPHEHGREHGRTTIVISPPFSTVLYNQRHNLREIYEPRCYWWNEIPPSPGKWCVHCHLP